MNNKLNTIGLCRKAGKLIGGFDAVFEELEKPKSKAAGILIAKDISAKTKKEVLFRAQRSNAKVAESDCTMDQLQQVLGKRIGVIAILDEGFYKSLSN